MKGKGFWKQQGREGPGKERRRMLDVAAQEKTRMKRNCVHRADELIYMKGTICPGDKTKVGVGEGDSECHQLQRKEVAEKGIKITANNICTSKSTWRLSSPYVSPCPQGVTMDTSVLRKQHDLHTLLALGKWLWTYPSSCKAIT